jgi:hypothetical protein
LRSSCLSLHSTGIIGVYHHADNSFLFFLFIYLFWWNWVNSGLHTSKEVLHSLSQNSSPFCSGYFGDGGLTNCLSGLALNFDPPDLFSQVASIIGMSHS